MRREIVSIAFVLMLFVSMVFSSLPLVSAAYTVENPYMPLDSDESVCAMKTRTDGYFYVPNIARAFLKIEMLFDDTLVGDQTGGISPYETMSDYPDGIVELKDYFLLSEAFGAKEGDSHWNYMADVNPDGIVELVDYFVLSAHYGNIGTYITGLTGVTVTFNTGEEISPDDYGFVTIPQDATSFTVKRYGNPIGAMVIFWQTSTPVAYSTSFEFTVPNDGDSEVWYYVLARIYVPSELAGNEFYLFPDLVDDWIRNVKINNQLKYSGGQPPTSVSLGVLGQAYHLLEFEFGEKWGSGILRFHVATTSGQYAWLARFRVYVPNHSDNEYRYTVTTITNFTNYDLYYFTGFADDYICNFGVNSTQWYEWQWDTGYGKIYAWQDGFLYPVFNSKEKGCFIVEFSYGEIWNGGLLDFQFVSWEMQKQRIGRPKFYMTTALTPQDASVKAVLQTAWIYGGSSWCDINAAETSDPTNFGFVTQGIRVMANGTIVNPNPYEQWFGLENPQEANLSISVGFKLDPRENDYIDIGIFFNLTSGNLYHSYWEGNETADPWAYTDNPVLFNPENIEIWTPPAVGIDTPALVYNDTSEVSFISPQFKVVAPFASTTTSGLLWYWFGTAVGGIFGGPFGVITASAAGFGMYELFNFIGNQQIVKSYEDQGNLTYRKLHSDGFNVDGDMGAGGPDNRTQALFIRLKAVQISLWKHKDKNKRNTWSIILVLVPRPRFRDVHILANRSRNNIYTTNIRQRLRRAQNGLVFLASYKEKSCEKA